MEQPSLLTLPASELLGEVAALLARGSKVTLRVRGNSMFPFLRSGRDSVVLEPAARFRPGDIVLARLPDKGFVLHRVLRLTPEGLLLKGDGNVCAVEACRLGEVCGRVSHIVRKGRRIDCRSRGERMRVWLWQLLSPFHRVILGVCRRTVLKR